MFGIRLLNKKDESVLVIQTPEPITSWQRNCVGRGSEMLQFLCMRVLIGLWHHILIHVFCFYLGFHWNFHSRNDF